jgi:putative ABC transport system permease protein
MPESSRFRFFRLVRKNLVNRQFRNIATILVFAIIAATFFSSQYLVTGAEKSLNTGISQLGADILVVPQDSTLQGERILLNGRPTSIFFEQTGYEKISRIPGVAKASPQIYIATLFASCCAAPVQMIAIDPEHDFTITPWLRQNPGITMGKDDIIIGSSIIQNVGNDLMFYGHNFHVVGILDYTGMGIDNSVFTTFEDAYIMANESGEKAVLKLNIPPGKVSAVLVKVEPGVSPEKVADEIRREVPDTKTIMPDGLLHSISSQLGAVTRILYGSTLAVTIATIPLLGSISAMVAYERRRELALLRALGATKGFLIRLMLVESFSLAIIGSLIGILSAAGFLVLYQDYIKIRLEIPLITPTFQALLIEGGGALLLTIGIAGISSLYPVLLITRSELYETIRKGES